MRAAELKLAATPDQLLALNEALGEIRSASAPTCLIVISTYYDSPDHKLRQKHMALCVREQDGRYIQTLKSSGSASLDAVKHKWEDVIAGSQPDPMAPESGPRLRSVVNGSELHPLFRTNVRRTIVEIETDASTRIEAALDEGEICIVSSGRKEALTEVELELKSGDPAVLYDIALRLLEAAPLRIEMRSKVERGYEQLEADGHAIATTHDRPIILDRAMTVEAALLRIGRVCIAYLLQNVPAALANQTEAVHQMRVAARRLRSALSAAKPILPAEQYRWVMDELKWLAGSLGSARNWHVFEADFLAPVARAFPFETGLKRLTTAAQRQRRIADKGVRETVLSQRFTATLLKLLRWFEARTWRDQPTSEQSALLFSPIGEVGPDFMERRWRQLRKRNKHFRRMSPEERHKLRIAVKKLRYTLEFLDGVFDEQATRALVKRLKPLQEDLGNLNDLRVTHGLVDELVRHENKSTLEISRAAGIVLGWHDRGLTNHDPKLRKRLRRLRHAKPFWPRAHLFKEPPLDPAQKLGPREATRLERATAAVNAPEPAPKKPPGRVSAGSSAVSRRAIQTRLDRQ
jgi:inorganic triphosphatase YgiF